MRPRDEVPGSALAATSADTSQSLRDARKLSEALRYEEAVVEYLRHLQTPVDDLLEAPAGQELLEAQSARTPADDRLEEHPRQSRNLSSWLSVQTPVCVQRRPGSR